VVPVSAPAPEQTSAATTTTTVSETPTPISTNGASSFGDNSALEITALGLAAFMGQALF
jgi:hypothetical protein